MKAAIVGLSGPALTIEEADLLRTHPPAGVILFARNVQDRAQLAALVGAVRDLLPSEAVLMVDQEGGRVARLGPPHWRAHPPAAAIGRLYNADPVRGLRAAFLTGASIGSECVAAGFDVVAAPVLDRGVPGAHDVIGDRAFGADPSTVARLGRALADGLLAAGAQPVAKHAPGHGRAGADSHLGLPVVAGTAAEAEADIRAFALNADLPWAMTAHILYPDWDATYPATLSRVVIEGVIRGRIGFGGVLVSDDLAMGALTGAPVDRALAALDAGCDLALYCAGDFAPTAALLAACPSVGSATAGRLQAARRMAERARLPLDRAAMADERDGLLT